MRQFLYVIPLLILCSCQNSTNKVQPEKTSKSKLNFAYLNEFTPEELDIEYIDSKDSLKIITAGHIHSLMAFDDLRSRFYQAIKMEQPDMVIFTGDLVFYNNQTEWDALKKEFEHYDFPYFITPGNHDIGSYTHEEAGVQNRRDTAEVIYLKNALTRYKIIEGKYCNIILLNSNDRLNKIDTYISKRTFKGKENLCFTHHNLFIEKQRFDSIHTSWTGTWYQRAELRNKLPDMDYFVNGDWNLNFSSQEFQHHGHEVLSLSVGNRMKGDPLFYTVLEIYPDTLMAYPKYLEIDSTHSWFKN